MLMVTSKIGEYTFATFLPGIHGVYVNRADSPHAGFGIDDLPELEALYREYACLKWQAYQDREWQAFHDRGVSRHQKMRAWLEARILCLARSAKL